MSVEERRLKGKLSGREQLLDNLDEIKTLSSLLSSLLEKAEKNLEESLEDFVNDKVHQLGSAIGGYFKCFDSFGVKTRAALEAKWSECYQCREIRDAVEGLLEAEENWNAFLDRVDGLLDDGAAKVTASSSAPCEVPLININTKSPIILRDLIGQKFVLLVFLRHFA